MDILALNCGSSSVKYQLFDWKEEVVAKGMVERVIIGDSFILHEVPEERRIVRILNVPIIRLRLISS